MQKFGINNLKFILTFVISLVFMIIDFAKDGKLSILEMLKIGTLAKNVIGIKEALPQVSDELKDLDKDEYEALRKHTEEVLSEYTPVGDDGESNTRLQNILNRSLRIGADVKALIEEIKALKSKKKPKTA